MRHLDLKIYTSTKMKIKKMSFICHKCDKALSSKRSLSYHLNKSLPCDLICKVCDFKCSYRAQYYRHMRTHEEESQEIEKKEDSEEEILELPRAEYPEGLVPFKDYLEDHPHKPELIPIDDFVNHSDYIKLLQEVSDAEDCEITMREIIREVVVKPTARTNLDRVNKAIFGLDPSVYMKSLQCLSNRKQLDDIACDVLTNLHGDEKKPEHHTICLSDSSRKTAKIYTRIPGDRPTWTLHPREASLHIIRKHTSNVMSLLLEHAVERLQDTSYIRDYHRKHAMGKVSQQDRIPCVCMSDSSDYIMICFDHEANICGMMEETPLLVEYVSYDDLFSPGNIDPVCFERLRESIQSRKEQILEQLHSLIIDEKKLVKFLNHTRPVCINAVIQ